jgi:mono/diheme cytochrome c family protein
LPQKSAECEGDENVTATRLRLPLAPIAAAAAVLLLLARPASADETQIARGKYLVTFGGCNDCHTPGYFFGKPDMKHYLGGSDVGFEIPGLGVFVAPNLTPDKATGLGKWTTQQIAAALTAGVLPDHSRILAPIMPWQEFSHLTKGDVLAIVAYLRSLPPVERQVPGPFGPHEKVGVFVMKIVPPDGAPAK